jgi:hypothetical protein
MGVSSAVADNRVAASHRADGGALLAVLLVAPFMAQADATIANVATPSIHADLGASGAALELVIGGYLIAFWSATCFSGYGWPGPSNRQSSPAPAGCSWRSVSEVRCRRSGSQRSRQAPVWSRGA